MRKTYEVCWTEVHNGRQSFYGYEFYSKRDALEFCAKNAKRECVGRQLINDERYVVAAQHI